MFGVGWTEMLVIGVVALIVIGPKDLPVVMHRLGKAVSTIRRLGNEFQREINKTTGLDQITDLRRSITEPLKQTADEITREFNRPLASGKVEPSGIIAPADPKAESVVSEINAKIAEAPAAATVAPTEPASAPVTVPALPVESPAPVEALAPAAAPVKKPRARKAAATATTADSTAEPAASKPATPRKPRATKPKAPKPPVTEA